MSAARTHRTSTVRVRRTVIATALAAAACATVGVVALSAPAQAATCSAVDVSFARGTGEAQGLGTVGTPFVNALTTDLPGTSISTYAVVYDANTSQSSAGPGATALTNHVTSVAAACPSTRFVLGGYSQGATVVDIALGIRTGSSTGTAIPAALSSRVAGIAVFGNPLGLQNQTIATASPTYGARSKDYCNTGDPVCGNGSNIAAHLQYASNGSAAAGAQFVANLVGTTPAPTPSPTTPAPSPSPTSPVPTPSPTTPAPAPTSCFTGSTQSQVDAGRAYGYFGRAYARGTNDALGRESRFVTVSLQQNGTNSWTKVASC